MPEAVIVATARSPIGRAGKGSLASIRPDDLTAQIVTAALAKVPQLDPADVSDLMLGCGLPGGEQGFNMARVVAILLGHDHLPGTTVNRYCSSSLQTIRMAFHAIKAGEGDAYFFFFISLARSPTWHHRQPVLLVVPADHPDGLPRDQGRGGRTSRPESSA